MGWGFGREMDTCLCVAESLPHSPEIVTTLLNWLYPNTKLKGLSLKKNKANVNLVLIQNVTMVMTSVSGHLLAHDFRMQFRKWSVQSLGAEHSDYYSDL